MSYPCSVCGQYHDTTACPSCQIPVIPAMSPQQQVGSVTFNGISLGEQQIIERLDKLIALVQDRREQ